MVVTESLREVETKLEVVKDNMAMFGLLPEGDMRTATLFNTIEDLLMATKIQASIISHLLNPTEVLDGV